MLVAAANAPGAVPPRLGGSLFFARVLLSPLVVVLNRVLVRVCVCVRSELIEPKTALLLQPVFAARITFSVSGGPTGFALLALSSAH